MATGRSRGFGFVEMASKEEGQKAIEQFNGTDLNGRNLTVNEARPRKFAAIAAVVAALAVIAAAVVVAVEILAGATTALPVGNHSSMER